MDVKLVVKNGKHAGQEVRVNHSEYHIGKSSKCHLRPGGDGVERHHCTILRKEGYAGVRDLDTTSGTFVNEKRVEGEQELKNGDMLRVGSLTFEVQLTVGISGKKKPKVSSISEAASRISQKSEKKEDEDLDIFAIFDEEAPTEEELPEFVRRKQRETGEIRQKMVDEDALAREKKLQESTRNAAADTIKALLNQAKLK